jgi:uncharacterized protein
VPYLIDGHNLIGKIAGLSLDDPHDEAKLVERLKAFMVRKRKQCTVVFDRGLPGGTSRDLSTHSVKAVFAHSGTTADRIIIERIRDARHPAGLIVVSADREILNVAERRGARVISPTVFATELEARPVPNDSDPNPHVSPGEVEHWLRIFGADPDDE